MLDEEEEEDQNSEHSSRKSDSESSDDEEAQTKKDFDESNENESILPVLYNDPDFLSPVLRFSALDSLLLELKSGKDKSFGKLRKPRRKKKKKSEHPITPKTLADDYIDDEEVKKRKKNKKKKQGLYFTVRVCFRVTAPLMIDIRS